MYRIKASFFQQVREQGDLIRGINCYCLVYYRLALKLASEFNYEWSMGEEWLTFMQKANTKWLTQRDQSSLSCIDTSLQLWIS